MARPRKATKWHTTQRLYADKTLLQDRLKTPKIFFLKYYRDDLSYLHNKPLFRYRLHREMFFRISVLLLLVNCSETDQRLAAFFLGGYQRLPQNTLSHTLAIEFCSSLKHYLRLSEEIRTNIRAFRRDISAFALEEETLVFLEVIKGRLLCEIVCALLGYYQDTPTLPDRTLFLVFLKEFMCSKMIEVLVFGPPEDSPALTPNFKSEFSHLSQEMRELGAIILERVRPEEVDMERLVTMAFTTATDWRIASRMEATRLEYERLFFVENVFRENQVTY